MASEDRPPQDHLKYLAEVSDATRRYGMFPVVRSAEARAPHLPRIGTASGPARDILSLSQIPSNAFPAPTIESIAFDRPRPDVQGYWLGLLGPMGPMPIHLTEFAIYERRYAKKQPFGRWLDMLANRMLQRFYRAWADTQPAASADRPGDDIFGWYVTLLCGAMDGAREDGFLPASARLQYASLLASPRSAVAIEDALSHLLEQDVTINEYQPDWYPIEEADQTRLGRSFCQLGLDMIVGRRIRMASEAFQAVIRADSLTTYRSLMPTGLRFAAAQEALNAFAPSHLNWEIAIELDGRHIKAARVDGSAQLGWTSWLGDGRPGTMRRDVRLGKGRYGRTARRQRAGR